MEFSELNFRALVLCDLWSCSQSKPLCTANFPTNTFQFIPKRVNVPNIMFQHRLTSSSSVFNSRIVLWLCMYSKHGGSLTFLTLWLPDAKTLLARYATRHCYGVTFLPWNWSCFDDNRTPKNSSRGPCSIQLRSWPQRLFLLFMNNNSVSMIIQLTHGNGAPFSLQLTINLHVNSGSTRWKK